MKKINVTVHALAWIEEEWHMEVPDDFDMNDAKEAFFDHRYPDVTREFISDRAIDEIERHFDSAEVLA